VVAASPSSAHAVEERRRPDTAWHGALPSTFSADALFTTLIRLPALSHLSLVALSICGLLPGAKILLAVLQALNIGTNYLYGVVPAQLAAEPREKLLDPQVPLSLSPSLLLVGLC
jgi:hypothetical protein